MTLSICFRLGYTLRGSFIQVVWQMGMRHDPMQWGQNYLEANPAATALHTCNTINITRKKVQDHLS